MAEPELYYPAPVAPVRDRVWVHILLFVLTLATTTIAGAGYYGSYLSEFGYRRLVATVPQLLLGGLWFSLPALAILGCHEMGHYVACRYYRINASLPYFLPFLPVPFGTLGAVIRIRSPFPAKRMLFDVGIAGPLAGFVVAVVVLILGMAWSHVARLPPNFQGEDFGESLLFKLVAHAMFGTIPEGYTLNAHPMVFAAWFGLFVTALNLLPVGQLDAGHIVYACIGRKAKYLTYVTLAVMLTLGLTVASNWLTWCVFIVALLAATGWEHPPTMNDEIPIDNGRIALALLTIVIFVLCFTPIPISVSQLTQK